MIIKDPYEMDWSVFPRVPVEDRWIYDKLRIAEKFDYLAGPVGVYSPEGTYCVRPIYNISGMAEGGFKKVEHKGGVLYGPPGYCWTKWTDAPRQWGEFINDDLSRHVELGYIDARGNEYYKRGSGALSLPKQLKDIGRYMLVEMLGDQVIDIHLRLDPTSVNRAAVKDYRTIKPGYKPPVWVGNEPITKPMLKVWDKKLQAQRWEYESKK
jgi:hypothetical protein